MKKIIYAITVFATLFAGCQKEVENVKVTEPTEYTTANQRIASSDLDVINGRIWFKTPEAYVQFSNNFHHESWAAEFKSQVDSLGSYQPLTGRTDMLPDTADYIDGFIYNSQGVVQIGEIICLVDFENKEYRAIHAEDEEELLAKMINRDADEGITTEPISGEKPNVYACTYCGLGILAFSMGGIPAGLLEAYSCYLCVVSLD